MEPFVEQLKQLCAEHPTRAKWVLVAYAPNRDVPLDVVYDMTRRGERRAPEWFGQTSIRERYLATGGAFIAALGTGRHFVDEGLPWNGWREVLSRA